MADRVHAQSSRHVICKYSLDDLNSFEDEAGDCMIYTSLCDSTAYVAGLHVILECDNSRTCNITGILLLMDAVSHDWTVVSLSTRPLSTEPLSQGYISHNATGYFQPLLPSSFTPTMHPELGPIGIISALSLFLPFPWHWRAGNVATLAMIAWLFSINIIYAVDAIIWVDNIEIVAQVWCDISMYIFMYHLLIN